jgi:hypothetical protein
MAAEIEAVWGNPGSKSIANQYIPVGAGLQMILTERRRRNQIEAPYSSLSVIPHYEIKRNSKVLELYFVLRTESY